VVRAAACCGAACLRFDSPGASRYTFATFSSDGAVISGVLPVLAPIAGPLFCATVFSTRGVATIMSSKAPSTASTDAAVADHDAFRPPPPGENLGHPKGLWML